MWLHVFILYSILFRVIFYNTVAFLYFCFWIYLTFSDCMTPVLSGMSKTERGFLAQRPNSTGSASYVSSCSHSSSSSSSGRGSVSPVGYHIAFCRRVVSASDPGGFSNPGEHDLDQENVRQNQLGKEGVIRGNKTK